MTRQHGVFGGLRVLDLSRWIAGEYATKLFGDFGAEVIKIERPGDGSLTRRWGPFPDDVPDPERSALFLHLNTNKRSIALDLTDPTDHRLLRELVRRSDALVESFRPGTLERLGMGPEVLHDWNPRLVITRISAFGQTGPRSGDEATGIVLQATGGPMNATGGAGRAPQRKPGNLEHYTIGRAAGQATMAGLLAARRNGSGSVIDVSGQEVLLSGADRRASYLMSHAFSGWIPPRGVRSAHRFGTTFTGPFPAADGYVMLYVTTKAFWNRLVHFVGDGDEQFLAKYLDRESLGEDWDDFDAHVRRWFSTRGKIEIMERGEAARIPVTALLEISEVLAHPHYRDRGAFVRADHPVAGSLEYTGPPWRMAGGFALHRTAPLLDGDGADIRAELAGSAEPVGDAGADGAEPAGGAEPVDGAEPTEGAEPTDGAEPIDDAEQVADPAPALITPHRLRRRGPFDRAAEARRNVTGVTQIDTFASAAEVDKRQQTELADAGADPGAPRGRHHRPLDGIRVVDLTVVWSGPGATALLGDLGAEVIRLEGNNRMSRQASSGVTRESFRASGYHGGTYPDRTPEPRPYDRTALFAWHARNKLSACCNLETPEGRQAALDLIAVSDVVVENNSNGTLEKLGLGHEVLLEHNPRLVIARMPPMGMTGPMSNYLGYGPNFNSLVGIAAMDGYEGETPDSAGENYHMDEAAPAGLAFAVQAALWDRETTGKGGLIEFAQAEAVMAEVGEFVIDWQLNGRRRPIRGNTDPHLLQDVFETVDDDRWVVLSIRDDRDWAALTAVMAGNGSTVDPAEMTPGDSQTGRQQHSRGLRTIIADWARTMTADEFVEALQGVGVPAGEVMAEDRLLADEHLAARGWFHHRGHPAVGSFPFPGQPWQADGFELAYGRPLPSFGEDNDYVYTEVLGYSAEKYDDLQQRKLVTDEQFA